MPDYMPPPAALPPGSMVWAYLRDSGGDGQEQSVPQQKAEIQAFCRRHNLLLGHIFADVARSGGSVIGRDAFNDLVDMVKDPNLRPRGLLLWNFARFARELDDSSYYKALIRKQGVAIHSLTDPIPDGAYGRVVEVIIDITNEEKRRQTSRDVKRSLAALVRRGYASGGFPPQGYQAEEVIVGTKRDGKPRKVSRWVLHPELGELARLAWQLRAQGKSYGEIQEATHGLLYNSKSGWPSFFANKTYLGIGKCGDLEIPLITRRWWTRPPGMQCRKFRERIRSRAKRRARSILAGSLHRRCFRGMRCAFTAARLCSTPNRTPRKGATLPGRTTCAGKNHAGAGIAARAG